MPVINCYFQDCPFVTADVGDAAGGAIIADHLARVHPIAAPVAAALNPAAHTPRIKVDRPALQGRINGDDWQNFIRDWENYRDLSGIPAASINRHLGLCCEPELKNELYGMYTQDTINGMTQADLLAALKILAVVDETVLSHRIQLSDITQSPGQPIHGFLAALKKKARLCALTMNCSNAACARPIDYSSVYIKDALVRGLSDDDNRQKLLAEPNSDDLTLDQVVEFLHRLEISKKPLTSHHGDAGSVTGQGKPKGCWACGSPTPHPGSNFREARKKHCKAWSMECKKCDGKGHYEKLCSKCTSCGEFGHRNQHFRSCSHNKKSQSKEEKPAEADEIGVAQVCAMECLNSNRCNDACKYSVRNGTTHAEVATICHHVFNEETGWTPAGPRPHPKLNATLQVRPEDHHSLGFPIKNAARLKSIQAEGISDTGCMSCMIPLKSIYSFGMKRADLIPTRHKMVGAGNEDLGIVGAMAIKISADGVSSRHLFYVSEKCKNQVYLSRDALTKLGCIDKSFPKARPMDSSASLEECSSEVCDCPKREGPPPLPTSIPEGFNNSEADVPRLRDWLIQHYNSSSFNTCTHQRLPMMTGEPLKLFMDEKAKPVACYTPAPVPIHWQDRVKADLDRDVRLGVLETVPVNDPVLYCSRMVVTSKANGEPRRTVDMQPQNANASRQTYPVESPFKLAEKIPTKTFRTVFDSWNSYHSVAIRKEDRHYTTFITPWGRYRYCVSPQGFLASGDGYNQRYDEVIAEVKEKVRCVDDTCLWTNSVSESFLQACKYLDICAKNGIVLNSKKFQFCQREVTFAGLQIREDGIGPSNKFLDAIRNYPTPTNISGARGWFGLVNQGAYAFSMAPIMAPFRHLLKPRVKFEWTQQLEILFNISKEKIIEAIKEGVAKFEPNLPTCVATDYSGDGLGFFLLQKTCDCESRTPICCPGGWRLCLVGSRFLHGAEERYAPLEGEMLSVVYALHQLKYFVLGCPDLTIATDHKPLLHILNNRSLGDIENKRIMNLKEKTLDFKFGIVHVPGKLHPGPDGMSRNPTTPGEKLDIPGENFEVTDELEEPGSYLGGSSTTELRSIILANLRINDATDEADEIECALVADIVASISNIVSWDEVKTETESDQHMLLLREQTEKGFPSDSRSLQPELRPYGTRSNDMSVLDGVILAGNRVIIPGPLRKRVLQSLHAAHQGIPAMKQRALESVWWPNITVDITRTRHECQACNQSQKSNPSLPPYDPPQPVYPFQMLCTDFFTLHSKHYLVIVDRFTNWPLVFQSNQGSRGLVNNLRDTFSTFGVAEEITSDGGPEYTADITQQFLHNWGVKHRRSSVANPHANLRAEQGVKQVKRILMENTGVGGSLNVDSFHKAMLSYRNTPDPVTKGSPAQLLFGREVRDAIPAAIGKYVPHDTWRDQLEYRERALAKRVSKSREKWSANTRELPPLSIGDTVFVQNQSGNYPNRWEKTGTIVEVKSHDQYSVKVDGSGRVTLRNRKFLRKTIHYQPSPGKVSPPKPVAKTDPPAQSSPSPAINPTTPIDHLATSPTTADGLGCPLTPGPEPPASNPATPTPVPGTPAATRSPTPQTPRMTSPPSMARRNLDFTPQTPPSKHIKTPLAMKRLNPHNQPGVMEDITGRRSARSREAATNQ